MTPKEQAASADYRDWHGHVRARPDNSRARCGGPLRCLVCQAEYDYLTEPVAASAAPVKEQAARVEPDAQLQVFGVDTAYQPTPSRFPKTLNPQGLKIWTTILESKEYADFKSKNPLTSKLWAYCIRTYLKNAAAADVYPFTGRHDFHETALSFLSAARKKLVKWFDQSEIFDYLKIKSISRDYTFTHQNFSLEVRAELRPISDPTFEAWLTRIPEPGFKKQLDGTYHKAVHAHIDVHFHVRGGVGYLTYRVFCHTPVRILEPGAMSKAKLGKYVETKLWSPLIKQYPVGSIGNRRF